MPLKTYCLLLGISSATAQQHPFSPNGRKAGAAGDTALAFWKDHLSWWHDWTPSPRGVDLWDSLIAPMGDKGAVLGSPAMCRQKDESWLKQFNQQYLARSWNFTAVHIFKPDVVGV
ncbi:hypothetical protein CCMA1212_008129 [Trichoderma ghanense]|uniref:Asl1-like glycosyl hydrolase catalytic domain-containing protein n=1 Tax=Trichoderma ghanense TaxID=65468 RepID=A0ABY2GVA8_9HYPO